nr:immunoglobulin heavy chain junction region [Mus musculus]
CASTYYDYDWFFDVW